MHLNLQCNLVIEFWIILSFIIQSLKKINYKEIKAHSCYYWKPIWLVGLHGGGFEIYRVSCKRHWIFKKNQFHT
jgi:hypothetical protein